MPYHNNRNAPAMSPEINTTSSDTQRTTDIVERQTSRYAKYLPIAYIDRVVLDSPEAVTLRATVDFCIRETLEKNMISEWISDPNLKKNLKIKLIQSTSQEATENLLFNINIADINDIEVIDNITIDDVIGGADNYIENNSSTDTSGKTTVSLYFRRSFNINNEDPDYLCYFILTYLEVSNNKFQNGYISKKTIINLGEVTEDTLTQDYRIFDKIKNLPINLSFVEEKEQALYKKIQSLSANNMLPTRKESYFSEIFLSRDRLNRANFIFAIDYYKIARDLSIFGGLYENVNNSADKSILSLSSIVSLSLKRRRIRESSVNNKLGSLSSNNRPLGQETIPVETLVVTRDSAKALEEVAADDYGIKELYVSTNSKTDTRFFAGYDNTIATMTGGIYQYGVEIIIEDLTKSYLSDMLLRLSIARTGIYSYYIEATKPSSIKYDPHLDTSKEEFSEKTNSSGNYNLNSNKFTQNFIDSQKEKKNRRDNLIILYVRALSLLTNINYNSTLSAFADMTDPSKASPQSILAVIHSIDDLTSKIEHIVDNGKMRISRNDFNSDAKSYTHSTKANRITNIEHWFTNSDIDASLENNYGYDYLSVDVGEMAANNGIRLLSVQDYSQRALREADKYSIGGAGGSVTTWSYLTPAFCYFGSTELNKVFDFYTAKDYEEYSTLSANILTYNSNSSFKELTLSSEKIKNTMTNFYSNVNLTIKAQDGRDLIKPMEPAGIIYEEPNVNPNDFFFSLMNSFSKNGATNKLSTDNPFVEESNSFRVGDKKIKPDELGIGVWGKETTALILSKVPEASQILSSPPIQIKSLMSNREKWGKQDPIKNLNIAPYYNFRYLMINRIEVLSGFNGASVKSLKWEPLTKATPEMRKNISGKNVLLCRIKPFELPIMGIKQPKGLKLPVYDNYFIIGIKK